MEKRNGLTRWFALIVALVLTFGGARSVWADPPTLDDIEKWLSTYRDAKPAFKPGDTLTKNDLEKLRPFIPPGYLEQLNFDGLKVPIIERRPHPVRKDYADCTEKYQNQVRLGPDAIPQNYVCGQPFSPATLSPTDPESGPKAIWDFEYRWGNYGGGAESGFAIWDMFTGSHVNAVLKVEAPPEQWSDGVPWPALPKIDLAPNYQGGGSFQRVLQWYYQRIYFTHLASFPDHTLPVPNAKDFLYKEFVGFYEPFDIRGTAFITYRYEDIRRSDDAWSYLPNLRRVRRISAEVKSDSLLGTDATLEDFFGFSGREPDWNFQFLGWKDVLCVMDPKTDYVHTYGPNGMIPDDQWSVRRMAVLARTPKSPRHPFATVVNFFDAETWFPSYHLNFDRRNRLWKVIQWDWQYTEDNKNWPSITHGIQSMTWSLGAVSDIQNERGTLWACGVNCGYPPFSAANIASLFDVNRLEQVHR